MKKNKILLSKTIRDNYSINEIEEVISKFSENFEFIEKSGHGSFIDIGDKIIAFHAGERGGRNSFIAQQWGAIAPHLENKREIYQVLVNKESVKGWETSYQIFILRCLITFGIKLYGFTKSYEPFKSVNEIKVEREILSKKNNDSSYIDIQEDTIAFFGKGYGAQAGESVIILSAIRSIDNRQIMYFPYPETKITNSTLPSNKIIEYFKSININIPSKSDVESDDNIKEVRNQAQFKFNLENKYIRECYICKIKDIENLIASHIWRVSDIKKEKISFEEKYIHATTEENGLWLCRNHDLAFERGNLYFDNNGTLMIKKGKIYDYLSHDKKRSKIDEEHMTDEMKNYLEHHLERIGVK